MRAPADETALVEAEQIKAHFSEGNRLNFAGAVVLTLIIYVVFDRVPPETWTPALLGLYLVTVGRALDVWRYRHRPESRSSAAWIRRQTVYGALAGSCWGLANTAMLHHLPVEHHLFILTVATVAAASSAGQGFACPRPSTAFVLASLVPPTLWLLTVPDRLHGVLAAMLGIFIPLTLTLSRKRNQTFVEAQRMRFRNEALAQELLRQRDLAQQMREAKSRFLAAASHDLRQPMQALSIFLDLLRQENPGGRSGELVALAQQSSEAMSSLLGTLLDISKLDAGVIKPNRRAFAVQELLDGIALEFRPLAERRQLRLDLVPCSASVDSDPVLLGQIVRNLVANAVRYTNAGGIAIGCRRDAGNLRIEVVDTGVGIASDEHEAIFREFYQVGNRERNRERGLGLGLAIVERMAKLLGHPLMLRSRPGAGSRFAVTVPRLAAAAPPEPAAVPPEPAPAGDLAGRRILVIDDEEAVRTSLQALLQKWGCQVVCADSAAAALASLDGAPPPEAVISDLGLGGNADGIDAITALRLRCGEGLPALLLTGDTSQAVLNAAGNAGLLMLHKPVRPARLRAALAAMLHEAAATPVDA